MSCEAIGKFLIPDHYHLMCFFLPLIINKALTAFFEQDTACIIMMIIGLLLIATHNIWIKISITVS